MEIREEGRNDTISKETHDYISSTFYKTDKILNETSVTEEDNENFTVADWEREIKDERANNTISKEAHDKVWESFGKVWKDL